MGTLLFLIYINDLAFISDIVYTILYADDTIMFVTGSNLMLLQKHMNDHLVTMADWLKANKLSLNIGKTHFMVFTRKKYDLKNLKFILKKNPVSLVKYTKFFGVFVDDE